MGIKTRVTSRGIVSSLSPGEGDSFDCDVSLGTGAIGGVIGNTWVVTPSSSSAGDLAAFREATSAAALVGGRVLVRSGTLSVTSDITSSLGVTVEFQRGAVLDVATGSVALFAGGVIGGDLVKVTGTGVARWRGRSVQSLWLVGDSLGVGSGVPFIGGWRTGIEASLRRFRSDFDFVGDRMTLASSSAGTGLAWHSCVSGETISAAGALVAQQLSGCLATPDAVVATLGTNDIVAGQTLAQMKVSWAAYESALFSALPNAQLFAVAPPVFVAGSSVGGNLSAWNSTRTSYVAWLSARSLADPRLVFVDPCASPGMSPGEFQSDGVHFNRLGNASFGGAIADALDTWLGPVRKGALPVPRMFRQRNVAGSVLVDAAGDVRTVTGAGCDIPAVGGFAVAIDLYPTALGAGPLAVLAIGPRNANPAMWLCIRQLASALDLGGYSGAGTWVTAAFSSAEDRCLVVNKWHRIVAIIHRGTGSLQGSAGLYVNGRLVGTIYGLANTWPASAQTLYLGNSPDYVSCPGYYSSLRVWSGPLVPRPGSMAALRAVEANFFNDEPVVPGATTSVREFDGDLLDAVSGAAASTLVGGSTALASAHPQGTPLRPWEIGADY